MLPVINSAEPSSMFGNIGIQLGSMLNSAKEYAKENNLVQPMLDSFNKQFAAESDPYAMLGMQAGSALNGVPDDLDAARQSAEEAVSKLIENSSSGASSTYSPTVSIRNSGRTVSSLSGGNPAFEYFNADLAKHYGMDRTAAYSEALQNTAYQRAVADLKAAGLNPVLAAGKVAGAGSFAAGDTLAGGSGSGSSGRRTGGNSGKYALSSDAYNLLGVAGSLIGGLVGFKMTPNPAYKLLGASTGMSIGKTALQGSAQGLSSLKNLFK